MSVRCEQPTPRSPPGSLGDVRSFMRAGHRRRRRAARRSGTSPSSRRRWPAVRTAAEQGQARALLRHGGRAQEVRRWVKSRSSVCRSGAGTCPCPNQMGNGNFTFSFPNGSSLLFGADGARLPLARYPPPRAPSHHAHLLHRSALRLSYRLADLGPRLTVESSRSY